MIAILKGAIQKLMSNKYRQLGEEELKVIFDPYFARDPAFDGKALDEEVKTCFGRYLPRETIVLMLQWNAIASKEQRMDPESILKPAKDDLHEQADKFLEAVRKSRHLQDVFTNEWVAGLRKCIDSYDGIKAFQTDSYTMIIGFIQEERRGQTFISTIDDYFDALLSVSSKKKSIRDKKNRLSKHLSNYAGGIFELFVLGPLAQRKSILEYEPPVGAQHNKAEALIKLGEFQCVIEATVSLESRPLEGAGSFDPNDLAHKMRIKLESKLRQVDQNDVPILIFYNPHVGVFDEEIELALEKFFHSESSSNVLGVIVARDYRMRRLAFFRNPDSAYSFPDHAFRELADIYPELNDTSVTSS